MPVHILGEIMTTLNMFGLSGEPFFYRGTAGLRLCLGYLKWGTGPKQISFVSVSERRPLHEPYILQGCSRESEFAMEILENDAKVLENTEIKKFFDAQNQIREVKGLFL